MLELIKYLNMPAKIAASIVGLFLVMQVVGELLEFKGKVVPEFLKVRKYTARKKAERKILAQIPQTLAEVHALLDDIRRHYDADNISMRDRWISGVDKHFEGVDKHFAANDALIRNLDEKLDKINRDTLMLLIENKRNTIINFASLVIDEEALVTREQYHRIFKLHKEYEDTIADNGMTNGEVDIAYRIISESYEHRLRTRSFIEDQRGYDISGQ